MDSSRKPWIGGNWKCNGTIASITTLAETLNKVQFDSNTVDVVICPTALHMTTARALLDLKYVVASQNVSKDGNGAFTGEISGEMLKDAGHNWTLIGHSERRQYYHEEDKIVAEKVVKCQSLGLKAAVCIGELLAERKSGQMQDVLTRQMEAFIPSVQDWSKIVIAYEPVWAIGTGVVATPEQAQEAHDFLRKLLLAKVDEATAKSVRIVYGGSVNGGNCKTLMAMPDIDGFLVGGASLKPEFADIIKSATSA